MAEGRSKRMFASIREVRRLALEKAAEYVKNLPDDGPGGTYVVELVDDSTGEYATIKVDCDISYSPGFLRRAVGTKH